MGSRLLLLLLLSSVCCQDPGDTFPSCLTANTTWLQENIFHITQDVGGAEECQQICRNTSSCLGSTWTSEMFEVIPRACFLFNATEEEVPCHNCFSGRLVQKEKPLCYVILFWVCNKVCLQVHLSALVQVFLESVRLIPTTSWPYFLIYLTSRSVHKYAQTPITVDFTHSLEMKTLWGISSIQIPVYFLRGLCLLFSSCQTFGTNCIDCTTGFLECDICDFDNMVNGECGELLIEYINSFP